MALKILLLSMLQIIAERSMLQLNLIMMFWLPDVIFIYINLFFKLFGWTIILNFIPNGFFLQNNEFQILFYASISTNVAYSDQTILLEQCNIKKQLQCNHVTLLVITLLETITICYVITFLLFGYFKLIQIGYIIMSIWSVPIKSSNGIFSSCPICLNL